MTGLPTENAEDHQALVELALKVWREAAKHKPARRLHVSVSNFVPKPHTPFQWVAQLSLAEMEKNLAFFKQHLRKRGLQFKWHKPWQSMLEGVFSRGDRRLAEVLLRAQQLGCRFDGWSEQLRPDLWRQAFAETGVDPGYYTERPRDLKELLPWAHLDCGVSKEYLWEEYERAFSEVATPDCRTEACNNCGVCDHKEVKLQLHQSIELESVVPDRLGEDEHGSHQYRLVFTKTGSARYLSHLEMVSIFQRAMRRADLPIAYSQGYNPNPRTSFGDALPLGLESRAEEMQVILRQPVAAAEICRRLNDELPTGLEVLKADKRRWSNAQAVSKLVTYEAALPGREWPVVGFYRFERRLLAPLRQKSKRGEVLIQLETRLKKLEALGSNRIRLSLIQGKNGNIRVRDLLVHIFDLPAERIQDARIMKISSSPYNS